MDDITDVIPGEDVASLLTSAQESADLTLDWLRDNGMRVAPRKSKLLVMANKELLASRIPQVICP